MGRLVRRYIQAHAAKVLQNLRGSDTAEIKGLYVEQNALGTITLAGRVSGLKIVQTAEAGVTMSGALGAIYVTNYVLSAAAGGYIMARFDDHGNQTLYCFLYFNKGNIASEVTYLMHLRPANTAAWNQTQSVSSQNGWIRVMVHNVVRYIPLYTTTP